MACFAQIFIYIIVFSKIKKMKIKTFPYLSTLKLKNKSETDLFFPRPYPCHTGKHPNINVETQIPLELI